MPGVFIKRKQGGGFIRESNVTKGTGTKRFEDAAKRLDLKMRKVTNQTHLLVPAGCGTGVGSARSRHRFHLLSDSLHIGCGIDTY